MAMPMVGDRGVRQKPLWENNAVSLMDTTIGGSGVEISLLPLTRIKAEMSHISVKLICDLSQRK